MRNILQLFYEMIVNPNDIDNKGYFSYNNHLFCLYEYKRNPKEIDALDYLNALMQENKIMINRIIRNVYNNVLTFYNNKNYVLVMINYRENQANLKFTLAINNQRLDILKRCDWGRLWSIKIDYIEYQLKHIRNSYPLINASVNYYIGLAENAISYFNMLNLANIPLYIEHRRILDMDIYNPLELIFDYKVRDISEYLKNNFIQGKMTIADILAYLKNLTLNNMDYLLLYVRFLYPSFYFDKYSEIINDMAKESEITKITDLVYDYEELLYEIYLIIKKKTNILGIEWLNQKYM